VASKNLATNATNPLAVAEARPVSGYFGGSCVIYRYTLTLADILQCIGAS